MSQRQESGRPELRFTREWVIKVSKFCNLRCRYCYEWNSLGNRERMSLSLWAKILAAIRTVNERTESETGRPENNIIIWHGGEPTLLPLDYLESVMELQRSTFPASWFHNGMIMNRIQSNLYSLSEEKVDFLQRHNFGIGVSFDVAPGARVDLRGNPTEARVLSNISRLRDRGIEPAITVVIAGHTAREIDRVYDFLRQRGQGCRLLPLFKGPAERPLEGVMADRATIDSALMRMFRLWFEDGCPFTMRPLDEYLMIVVMKVLGLKRGFVYDRRIIGDRILVVDLDGRLYEPCADYSDEFVLGNLSTQTINQILESREYRRSLERNDDVRGAVCEKCEYFEACGAKEMFMVADGGREEGRCMTAQPLCRSIEQYLRQEGIDEDVLRALFMDSLQQSGTQVAGYAAA